MSARQILWQSKNPEIQKLYTLTSSRHINQDCLINSVSSENQNQVLTNKQFNSGIDHKFNKSESYLKQIFELERTAVITLLYSHILKVCAVKVINMWQTLTKWLPSNIFNFCRTTLILCLPNKSTLYHWKITEDNQYFLCHHMQTQLHVLSNCEKCLNIYTWRLCVSLMASYNSFPTTVFSFKYF